METNISKIVYYFQAQPNSPNQVHLKYFKIREKIKKHD